MGNAIYTNGVRVRNMRHKLVDGWNKSRKVGIVVNSFIQSGIIPNVIKTGAKSVDFVLRVDGQCLVAYSMGASLYLSIIEKEQDLLLVPEIAGDGTLFYTCGQFNEPDYFKLIKLQNGKILLIISDCGSFTKGIPFKNLVYVSANGLGTDFELLSTPFTQARIYTSLAYLGNSVSKPVQLVNGRIVFFTHTKMNEYGYDMGDIVILVSDDFGLTWITKYQYRWGLVTSACMKTYRNTVSIENAYNNIIMGTLLDTYGMTCEHLLSSTDGGDTWVLNTKFLTNHQLNRQYNFDFGVSLDGYLYFLENTSYYSADLYRMPTTAPITAIYMEDYNNWELYASGLTILGYGDGHMLISSNGLIHELFQGRDSGVSKEIIKTNEYRRVNL